MANDFQPYSSSNFVGAALSYAGQGVCSVCQKHPAAWMKKSGRVTRAYCEACKEAAVIRERAKSLLAIAHRSDGDKFSYWYGFVCHRADMQDKRYPE